MPIRNYRAVIYKDIADFAFDIRQDVSVRGTVLNSGATKVLAAKGFDRYFSGYSNLL
jgi:hypothetical protein